MSEYQYYEFLAIDRPLTKHEMGRLRGVSTRAEITPTRFTNTYHWGSFGGDPQEMVERYFDAFLHTTNWGSRELMLRLPIRLLSDSVAEEYCYTDAASVTISGRHVILSFVVDRGDDDDEFWDEDDAGGGEEWLSSIVPARADLADGDLRLLYLGWLLAAQNGDLDDEELEPAVPPGMARLPESLRKFAEFLRIDDDLIAAAAEHSAELGTPQTPQDPAVREWVRALAAKEKDDVILGLLTGEDPHLRSELWQRFRAESGQAAVTAAEGDVDEGGVDEMVDEMRDEMRDEGRTVGELLFAAATLSLQRT